MFGGGVIVAPFSSSFLVLTVGPLMLIIFAIPLALDERASDTHRERYIKINIIVLSLPKYEAKREQENYKQVT